MAAPDAQVDDGPPLTELESLQLKANQITDDSLDSTRRMINLCEDSQGAATRTVEMLEHQGEQLRRVEEGIDDVNAGMKEAEKHLTGMEKWCGLFRCPFNRAPKVRDSDFYRPQKASSPSKGGKEAQKNGKATVPDSVASPSTGAGGQYIRRINNDAREDEMEENMQMVGGMLSNLKNMAVDMGNEIENQNNQLDRVVGKSENVDVRIQSANKRTEQLLK